MELMVAVMQDDVVCLGVAVLPVEDSGRGQAEGLQVGSDEFGGNDPGRGKINPWGFSAIAATLPRVLPLIAIGVFDLRRVALCQGKPFGRK